MIIECTNINSIQNIPLHIQKKRTDNILDLRNRDDILKNFNDFQKNKYFLLIKNDQYNKLKQSQKGFDNLYVEYTYDKKDQLKYGEQRILITKESDIINIPSKFVQSLYIQPDDDSNFCIYVRFDEESKNMTVYIESLYIQFSHINMHYELYTVNEQDEMILRHKNILINYDNTITSLINLLKTDITFQSLHNKMITILRNNGILTDELIKQMIGEKRYKELYGKKPIKTILVAACVILILIFNIKFILTNDNDDTI